MKKVFCLLPAAAVLTAGILLRNRLTHVFVPLFLAAILTVFLQPPTAYLHRKTKLNRSGAAALSMVGLLLLLALLTVAIMPVFLRSLREVVNNSGQIAGDLTEGLGGLNLRLQRLLGAERDSEFAVWMDQAAANLCSRFFTALESWASGLLDGLAASYREIFAAFLDGVTALVISFYFLRDGRQLRLWILEAFPFAWRETLSGIFSDLSRIFSDFLQGQLLVSLILGVFQTIGLLFLGIPYAPILGFFGGILNIIPYFGPFIGAIPAVLAAFFVSPMKALWTALIFLILQQVDNNLLTPKIVEGRLGVHPITTILTVFLGGEFFGLWGVLLAVPAYAAVKSVFKRVLPSIKLPA